MSVRQVHQTCATTSSTGAEFVHKRRREGHVGPVTSDPERMNELLVARTTLRGGFFTAADALASGYDRQALSRLCTGGAVIRIGRGAYAGRAVLAAASPDQRHKLTIRAVVRRFDGRVAASHYSALILLGLPV